jgi:hypothetical protein
MDGWVRVIEKCSDTVALNSRKKFIEGLAVGREWFFPLDQILVLRDDLHRPVTVGARGSEYVDENRDIVVCEFAGEFGVFELFLLGHVISLFARYPDEERSPALHFIDNSIFDKQQNNRTG